MFTSNRSILSRTIVATVLAIGSVAAASANATPTADSQRIVKFQDLDLSTFTGNASLYARLQAASRAVCEPLASRDLSRIKMYNDCYEKALDEAVREVRSLSLSTLHGDSQLAARNQF